MVGVAGHADPCHDGDMRMMIAVISMIIIMVAMLTLAMMRMMMGIMRMVIIMLAMSAS